MEYIFNNAGSDTVNLYLNPGHRRLGPGGTGVPASANATSTGDFTGNQNIQSFVLRSNSTLPMAVNVDNVLVGTTWASVIRGARANRRVLYRIRGVRTARSAAKAAVNFLRIKGF